ncbi:MAG: phospholipase D-like domain-containing protein [Elusimicrobiota bacterium]|jgi:phosphatidylserine/phosphatidylglycerophosphate/cardiolipin synthase-like enzyme
MHRRYFFVGLLFALAFPCTLTPSSGAEETGSLRQQIIEHIRQSRQSVDIVVYQVGSTEVSDALIEAHQRGIRVRVIVDDWRSSASSPSQQAMEDDDIPIRWIRGRSTEMMHDKFVIFDRAIALTPSYNRSKRSLQGAGNNAFSDDPGLVKELQAEFENLWKRSQTQKE